MFSYLSLEAPSADLGHISTCAGGPLPERLALLPSSAAGLDSTSPLPGSPADGQCWSFEGVSLG